MRVLVLSHLYPSKFNEVFGIFVHKQAKFLMRRSLELKVVAPVPWTPFPLKYLSQKWKNYSKIPDFELHENIEVYRPPFLTFPKSLFFAFTGKTMYLGIEEKISRIREKFPFDLIHAHAALPSGYAAMLLSKKWGGPFVLTIHGLDFNETFLRGRRYQKSIEKVMKAASTTMVVSKKLKRVIEQLLPAETSSVEVVHNGIDPNDVYSPRSNVKKPWHGKKVVISVSNLIQEKGINYNLEAVAKLLRSHKDILYVIVGDGPEKERLQNLARKLKIESHVEFKGQLPHKNVMELIYFCDVFSLPSWKEGFGIVYLEAMAHGKPVIGCKGEGGEDVIIHGSTGFLVAPHDVEALYSSLNFLLKHPEKAKTMGDKAKRMVLEKFTWDKNAEKTIKIYEKVIHATK